MFMNVTSLGTSNTNTTNQAGANANIVLSTGNVWTTEGFPVSAGANINKVYLNVTSGSGNIRVKIYDFTTLGLLGESGSIAVSTTGIIGIPVTAVSNGQIYVGFEQTNNVALRYMQNGVSCCFSNSHTFGPGPTLLSSPRTSGNDFYAAVQYSGPNPPHVRVKIYDATSGSNLLGESGSIQINNTGMNAFPVSAISLGQIRPAFETDSNFLGLRYSVQTNCCQYVSNTFGPGPSSLVGSTLESDLFFTKVQYTTNLITLTTKLDGSLVTTNPESPVTSTTGTFSGVTFTVPTVPAQATHIVNVTDSANNFATATLIVPGASSFTLTGYILANNGIFNPPKITLAAPPTANLTSLMLFNGNGQLLSFQNFSPGIALTANTQATIPATLQDNSNPSGTVSYYEQAVIQSGSTTSTLTSNTITLTYGSITNGNLNFNQTNTNTVPIYFIRKDLNKTDTRLSVIYPNTMNMKCNLGYQFAFINQTYGPPISNIPYQGSNVNSSFKFHNVQNEIINVICIDTITNSTGRYVITENVFPFQTQVAQFRAGQFGTQGNFGIFDFVSLGVIVLSMIGFNRKNESVGMFFSIGIIGAAAFFGIVTLPTFIIGAIIVVGTLAYTSTRKQSEVF
jgi:hypothetical protein